MIADSRAGGQLFGQRGGRRPLGKGGVARQNEAGGVGSGSEWSGYAPERTQRAAAQICDQGEGKKKPAGCMGPAGSRRRAHEASVRGCALVMGAALAVVAVSRIPVLTGSALVVAGAAWM